MCKIAVLKGCEKEAGKLLLAVVKSGIGFNLIKDITVKKEENIMGVMQWLALHCIYLYFLQIQLIGNRTLCLRHTIKWATSF